MKKILKIAVMISAMGIMAVTTAGCGTGNTTSNISSDASSESKNNLQDELNEIERKAAEIDVALQNESITQTEINRMTAEKYKLWDDELNTIWNDLQSTLDSNRMNTLTEEQREWIQNKDEAVASAGKEADGGSMQAMLENDKAAELTRARVYELAEYYEKAGNQ